MNVLTLLRCGLRLVVIGVCGSWGYVGFLKSFAVLLLMTAVLCILAGLIRRDGLLGKSLSAWDEAAIYGYLARLTLTLLPDA